MRSAFKLVYIIISMWFIYVEYSIQNFCHYTTIHKLIPHPSISLWVECVIRVENTTPGFLPSLPYWRDPLPCLSSLFYLNARFAAFIMHARGLHFSCFNLLILFLFPPLYILCLLCECPHVGPNQPGHYCARKKSPKRLKSFWTKKGLKSRFHVLDFCFIVKEASICPYVSNTKVYPSRNGDILRSQDSIKL